MQGSFKSGKYESKSQFTLILLHMNLFQVPDEGLSIWVALSPLIDVFFNIHLVAEYVLSDFHSKIDYYHKLKKQALDALLRVLLSFCNDITCPLLII